MACQLIEILNRKIFKLLGVTGLLFLTGCYYDKEELLYPGNSSCQLPTAFVANVNPVIQSKCATTPDCHASGSSNTGGPFTTYSQIKNMSNVIRGQLISGLMPKTGSLTSMELQTIICWIDAGAPNN